MRYGLTSHAVERFIERVKPALDHATAKAELRALVDAAGEATSDKPDWHLKEAPNSRYLVLSDGIAATVQGKAVLTVLTRAAHAPDARARKKKRKQEERAKRHRKRTVHTKNGRGELRNRKEAGWR